MSARRVQVLVAAALTSCLTIGAVVVSDASARTIHTSDGDFVDWSSTEIAAQGSSAIASVQFDDGNTDSWMDVTTVTGRAWSLLVNDGFSWDPATGGAITELSMELDVKSITGWGQGQTNFITVVQDSKYYTSPFWTTGPSTSWHTVESNAFTEGDFGLADLPNVDHSDPPDFSRNGSPLRFGFGAANGNSGTYTQLYDNWRLTLTVDPPVLQPGDADQDLDFDQLDLVQVQVASKYLTGELATWGEGDWNGAPGGYPGDPPLGDGVFNQLDIVSALNPAHYLTGSYWALSPSGTGSDGQTSIVYDANSTEFAADAPLGVALTSINMDSVLIYIPEPSAIALLCLGLLGIGLVRQRREVPDGRIGDLA